MKTINDIITIARTVCCHRPKECFYCEGYSYCRVNTMFIALEYLERGEY